jgi:hypothetical protein
MAHILEGKSIGLDQKTELKGELLIWRTKNQARDRGYSPTQKFNFASNQSKLVPRKLELGPSSKVGLSLLCRGRYCRQCLLPLDFRFNPRSRAGRYSALPINKN